MKKLKIKEFSK